jgi:hypothetical protein
MTVITISISLNYFAHPKLGVIHQIVLKIELLFYGGQER